MFFQIQTLPLECLNEILNLLEIADLRALAGTNGFFSCICKDNQIWKEHCSRMKVLIHNSTRLAFESYRRQTIIPIFLCKMRLETFKLRPFGFIKYNTLFKHGHFMSNRMFDNSFMIMIQKTGEYMGVKVAFGKDTWWSCGRDDKTNALLWFPSFCSENVKLCEDVISIFRLTDRNRTFVSDFTKIFKSLLVSQQCNYFAIKKLNKLSNPRIPSCASVIDAFDIFNVFKDTNRFKHEITRLVGSGHTILFCDQFTRRTNMIHCRTIVVTTENTVKMLEFTKRC